MNAITTTSTTRVLRFAEHGAFHRAALRMSAAGALAGLAAHALAFIEPRLGGLADPLPLAIVAGAALHGAVPRETRARAADLALVVLAASAAAFVLTAARRGHLGPAWGAVLFAAALGLLFARGLGGARLWILAASGAGAALVGRFVLGSLNAFEPGPAWLAAGLSGAAFGAVAVLGVLPRHISLGRRVRGEVAEILARARAVMSASDRAGDDAAVREAIRADVARLGEVAGKWQELERQVSSSPEPAALNARIADLDARIAAATDSMARAQFEQARAEVARQLGEVESMRGARERVLARMHHSLAAIERRRLGAVGAEIDVATQALVEAEEIIMHTVDGRPGGGEPA
ncbi:MAG TPA: hypothetical protein VKB80_23230 [Kofleriaceae bacterium]|nr:hypothetical protein [Kofleriaceae bacterium]